jgi:uncharacterized short protein YbdD (DUF466 family)
MSKSKHEFHRNIAIIIGINDYSNGVPRLETAVPDAEEFARLMQERYQYEVHLLLNEKATLNQLKELIDCFRKKKYLLEKIQRLMIKIASYSILPDME